METTVKPEEELDPIEDGASNLQLLILFISVFIDLIGFGMIIPILPFLNETLGGTSLDYGLIIAIYSLMQFIFSPIWGSISDKIGRKPVIVIGLGGSSIGFAMFGFAYNLWVVYVARAVAGIFTAATLTTSNAYIADVTPPNKRGGAFSLISAAFGLGFALGPGFGGLLAGITRFNDTLDKIVPLLGSHVVPSFVAAILALVSMMAAIIFLPESLKDKITEKVKGRSRFPILDTWKYRKNRNSLLYIFVFAFIAFGLSMFITIFPLYALAIDSSISQTTLGWYFTFIGIMLFVTQTFFIRGLINKFGEAFLVKAGLSFMILGFIGVSQTTEFIWTFLPNGLFILGVAFLLPTMNSLISNSASQEDQGNIMGISQGWSAFMRIFGPTFGGYVFEFGINIGFYIGASIYVILLVISLLRIDESPGKNIE